MAASQPPRTFSIDIGGSGVKAMLLAGSGERLTERIRVATPQPATPEAVLAVIHGLAGAIGTFDRISAGFPGVVRGGKTFTAHNLDEAWVGFDLANALSEAFGKPARVANDAVVQGLAAIQGSGVELVVTLGTGVGASLFIDGRPLPGFELAHHPFHGKKTYEEQLGNEAYEQKGKKRWNRQVALAIHQLNALLQPDFLYIGGGNAGHITLPLPPFVQIVPNENGILGGLGLWRPETEILHRASPAPKLDCEPALKE